MYNLVNITVMHECPLFKDYTPYQFELEGIDWDRGTPGGGMAHAINNDVSQTLGQYR